MISLANAADQGQRPGVVMVVDGDAVRREHVLRIVRASGLTALGYESSIACLVTERFPGPACVILGMGTPASSVIDLKERMRCADHPPILCVGGSDEVSACTAAMKAGAVDYLPQSFSADALLRSIGEALARDADNGPKRHARARLQERHSRLTRREREVFALVVGGLLNKQAADALGIGLMTLKSHRGKVMEKMEADSFADLVRMAGQLNLPLPRIGRRSWSAHAGRGLIAMSSLHRSDAVVETLQ